MLLARPLIAARTGLSLLPAAPLLLLDAAVRVGARARRAGARLVAVNAAAQGLALPAAAVAACVALREDSTSMVGPLSGDHARAMRGLRARACAGVGG
jgi:hypothetical protein